MSQCIDLLPKIPGMHSGRGRGVAAVRNNCSFNCF